MAHRSTRVTASVLLFVCALACGCSSGSTAEHRSSVSSSGSASIASGAGTVQGYLDAVNKLCDALLPKVIAVTKGGSLDIPLKDYLAQAPAHAQLLADFDRDLAHVPVPPLAQAKADALDAYIRFANQLDARRLAAAKQGSAAYAAEISAESASAADPTIAARNAAGFSASCDAR